jgi:hypothetical protein
METVPADQPQDQTSRYPAIHTFDHASSEPIADGCRHAQWPFIGPSNLWLRDEVGSGCAAGTWRRCTGPSTSRA